MQQQGASAALQCAQAHQGKSDHVYFSRVYLHIAHIYSVFAHTHAHHPGTVAFTP
jgi:hypothetical protein